LVLKWLTIAVIMTQVIGSSWLTSLSWM